MRIPRSPRVYPIYILWYRPWPQRSNLALYHLHPRRQIPSPHTRYPTPLQLRRHKRLNILLPNRRIEPRTPIRRQAPRLQTPPIIPIPTTRTGRPPERPRRPSRPANILLILRHIINQFRNIARATRAIRPAEFRDHGFEAVGLEPGRQGRQVRGPGLRTVGVAAGEIAVEIFVDVEGGVVYGVCQIS